MLLFLAPMDGITDTSCRQIVKKVFEKYGDKENYQLMFVTEFVTADGFFHNPEKVKDHLDFHPWEKPLIAQIFGANEKKLLYTAKKIDKKYDFDGIELNIWCPSPKIVKQWAGSGLMKDKDGTLDLIRKLSDTVKRPFSIKTRIGLNTEDKDDQFSFLIEASKYCSMITIHARYYTQANSWETDYDFVVKVKQECSSSCKIIYNGGIRDGWIEDKDFLKKVESLDGIMIWQSAIWNPWVFVDHNPTWEERKEIILEHAKLMVERKGERRWLIEFRKFISNYISNIRNASKYRVLLMDAKTVQEFDEILQGI